MAGPLEIAYQGPAGRVVVTDSLTYCDERLRTTDVVVGGSFAGLYAGALPLLYGARAVIANAAGVGKDGSGIALLPIGQRYGVPCAAVSELSARLADGSDTYASGSIAYLNDAARALGLREGLACAEAARLLLQAPPGLPGRAAELAHPECSIVWDGPEGRVAAMSSVGLARAEHAGYVICAGSHTGDVTYRYVSGYRFAVAGVICNDCGVGKERAGISGLEPLAAVGIAAASVSHRSARIGDGRSTFRDGIISHLNRVAEQAGLCVGMPAREAALRLLRTRAQRPAERHAPDHP